jgi:hypothetical protein
MIAFARANQTVLWTVFCIAALSVPALQMANQLWPDHAGEGWGWMMLFAALPWSIAAAALPGWPGMLIWAVGLGVNAVIVTALTWYAISWWLKTLRFGNDA